MKTKSLLFVAVVAIISCNNTDTGDIQKIKDLAKEDSLKSVQATQKDSLITSYLNDLNEIQENLDRIKQREKIITMKPSEMTSNDRQTVVAEVKELDEWIVNNDKKMNTLQSKLKKMDTKNNKLESLVAHLTQEISEKDEEIASLQSQLGKANDSIRFLSSRFNDSIYMIKKQRSQIAVLSTVYYISGTIKELEDKGVINKEGGFIGLGRVAEINSSLNNSVFTKANFNSLRGISLHGRFRRFITVHPDKTYEVINNSASDSIAINMPATFWSESKYLVVATR